MGNYTPKIWHASKPTVPVKTYSFEDLHCPVCFEFIAEPITTPCRHVFCATCHKQFKNVKPQCPMCRKDLQETFEKVEIDLSLQDYIQKEYPEDFSNRKAQLIKQGKWQKNLIDVLFEYGNEYEKVVNPRMNAGGTKLMAYKWKMFIRIKDELELTKKVIRKVEYTLHPTYIIPKIEVPYPFTLEKLAWGSFNIQIKITFQPWTKIPVKILEHYLCFDGNGKTDKFL